MTLGRASDRLARSEIADIDRRNRPCRLTDARHHAERPHADECLGEGSTANAVIGDIDATLAGEVSDGLRKIRIAADNDVRCAGLAGDRRLGFRTDGPDHDRAAMGRPARQQLPEAAGGAVNQQCRA